MKMPMFLKRNIIGYTVIFKCPKCGSSNQVVGRIDGLDTFENNTEPEMKKHNTISCISCGEKEIGVCIIYKTKEGGWAVDDLW